MRSTLRAVSTESRSTPALANGDLYLRTAERLICIRGTGKD